MRKYIAVYEYSFYGTYTQEIEFFSDHRANSKANKADALHEIWRTSEKGIARSAEVLRTYLAE